MLGLFKKKKKEEGFKKIEMKLNPSNNKIEYRCPYCNYLITSQYYADPNKINIDVEFCPECSKEFVK